MKPIEEMSTNELLYWLADTGGDTLVLTLPACNGWMARIEGPYHPTNTIKAYDTPHAALAALLEQVRKHND